VPSPSKRINVKLFFPAKGHMPIYGLNLLDPIRLYTSYGSMIYLAER
jgi:hypothetical protein